MANPMIQLWAEAKTLGIDGYRKMTPDELKAAIKSAKGTKSSPGKAEKPASTNGASAKRGSAKKTAKKSAVKTADNDEPKKASRKSTSKTTARKSSVKSAPATSAKSGTAKRPASGAGDEKLPNSISKLMKMIEERGLSVGPGRRSVERLQRILRGETKPAKVTKSGKSSKSSTAKVKGEAGRALIDNSSIDWTLDSSVGNDPKSNRGVIMKALRKAKGNVAKVFGNLKDEAQTMYPKTTDGKKRSKADAQALLRWHISRVKYDYVKDTDQHESITRSSKPASAAKKPAKSKAASKATRKPAAAKKPAQRATGAKKSGSKKTASKTASRKRK